MNLKYLDESLDPPLATHFGRVGRDRGAKLMFSSMKLGLFILLRA